jgi:hypothetical protein
MLIVGLQLCFQTRILSVGLRDFFCQKKKSRLSSA